MNLMDRLKGSMAVISDGEALRLDSRPSALHASGFPSLWQERACTHFLDKTRGNWLPVPVNGSLRNYDYVQPRAPRAGLSGERCLQSRETHSETLPSFPAVQTALELLVENLTNATRSVFKERGGSE